jgi:diacylglycerol kinase family enzyme
MIRDIHHFRLLKILSQFLFSEIKENAYFNFYQTDELWIESAKEHLHVALDGELAVLRTPLHYQIYPRVLNMIGKR